MKSFASDNYASVHPKILKALGEANTNHAPAYGADAYTEKLAEIIKTIFGPHAEAFPVFNGTGANVTSLSALLRPFEGVICTQGSHINVDECGAAERILGTKLIDVPTADGKLSVEKIKGLTLNYGNEHQVQGKVLALTQSTERGTLYSLAELEALKTFAKEKGVKTFIDGARFANAVAALGVSPRKIVETAGVDILTLGGTKNGLMLGELIVTFRPEIAEYMKFFRKQTMQLASKMRYISAQFCAYFEHDLWIENAHHANQMAKLLRELLKNFPHIHVSSEPEVNAIFARIPRDMIAPLQKDYPFYVWEEETAEVRWMCSFDTTEEDIKSFCSKIKSLSR